jgi:hypothetical protein
MARTEFCQRAGINPGTLSWWKWKLNREEEAVEAEEDSHEVAPEKEDTGTSVEFVEIKQNELMAVGYRRIELVVAGVEVRVSSTLADRVDVLEARR